MSVEAQNDFIPLLYSFFRGAETFTNSLKEYEKGFSGKSAAEAVGSMGNYDFSIDELIDNFLPEKYRPIARVAKNWPWSFTVDLFSTMLKEYGKDGGGEYKTSGEVLTSFIKGKIKESIFR